MDFTTKEHAQHLWCLVDNNECVCGDAIGIYNYFTK